MWIFGLVAIINKTVGFLWFFFLNQGLFIYLSASGVRVINFLPRIYLPKLKLWLSAMKGELQGVGMLNLCPNLFTWKKKAGSRLRCQDIFS